MDEHAIALLEMGRVLDELAELCVSPQGAALIRGQEILTDAAALDARLDLSLEARAVLESGATLPGFDFPDIEGTVPRLGKEGMQLEGEELAGLGRWILSGLKLKRLVVTTRASGPLASLAATIPDLTPLSRRIFRIVDHEGLLREKQIPELAAIRERIRRHREDADKSVRGLLDDHTYRGWWQTTTPTQRDGRLVLPLKAQYRGRVQGIVHEMSATGSTVFIEPLEVVEKNNAIVQEENLYRLEVRRILRDLTREVSARASDLDTLVHVVSLLDTLFSRARYAVQHSCRRAEREGRTIALRDARHPLLGGRAVPMTVTMTSDLRVLIITGPNTGGKTVSLKTVGLLALMNQFGMEIPAGEGSILPIFDTVYADIGDEQSIEQSLSTFSAHVKNLAGIVHAAGPRSLVLLDELGAGTDPQEGVALAMALLDHFMAMGCAVMATTHHGILKNYGATRPGAQNASMGFDRDTLAPTYRILMGVPGESHALQIARRSGMPSTILDAAASYLDDERTDISRLVSNLAERHQKLAEAEEEHEAAARELREKRRSAELKEQALREKELELRRQGLRELRDFLRDARAQWENLRAGTAPTAADFSRLVAGVQERVEREERRIEEEKEALTPQASFDVREGMEVVIARTGRRGRVVRHDKGKRWVVETETIRLSLLAGELRPMPAGADAATDRVSVSYVAGGPWDTPVLELNLIGQRVEEALRLVEKQVDSALVHGLREFAIVHGKGEGKLRTAIHAYLHDSPVVQEYHFSSPQEGGFGRTVVTLKS
ncbi:MAG TPA: endonuclease MutS2 [Spirochaetia bacterium]